MTVTSTHDQYPDCKFFVQLLYVPENKKNNNPFFKNILNFFHYSGPPPQVSTFENTHKCFAESPSKPALLHKWPPLVTASHFHSWNFVIQPTKPNHMKKRMLIVMWTTRDTCIALMLTVSVGLLYLFVCSLPWWRANVRNTSQHPLYGVQHIHINLALIHCTFYCNADTDQN